jgi:hypothetical protein
MPAVNTRSESAIPSVAPSSLRAARLALARAQCAQFPTRLALARWTSGGNLPHLRGSGTPPLRAAWFACAQRDFQAWLENGGFVQHEDSESDDSAA